jgi:hypothetical protein
VTGDGSEANPFRGIFSGIGLQRHDSELFIGICERDDGFEIMVYPNKDEDAHRFYRIAPDGNIIDLAVANSNPELNTNSQGGQA